MDHSDSALDSFQFSKALIYIFYAILSTFFLFIFGFRCLFSSTEHSFCFLNMWKIVLIFFCRQNIRVFRYNSLNSTLYHYIDIFISSTIFFFFHFFISLLSLQFLFSFALFWYWFEWRSFDLTLNDILLAVSIQLICRRWAKLTDSISNVCTFNLASVFFLFCLFQFFELVQSFRIEYYWWQRYSFLFYFFFFSNRKTLHCSHTQAKFSLYFQIIPPLFKQTKWSTKKGVRYKRNVFAFCLNFNCEKQSDRCTAIYAPNAIQSRAPDI